MAQQIVTMVPIDSLILEGNVRTQENLDVQGMVACYRKEGVFDVSTPILVSQKGDRALVLRGNRRTLAALWLRENDLATFEAIFPKGMIPAVVRKGLTAEEEVLLRIDHGNSKDRKPLDEFSLFNAIRQLVFIGEVQEVIAIKLDLIHERGKNKGKPNRPYVQPRVSLAHLPGYIQDEYRKYCYDRNSTVFRPFSSFSTEEGKPRSNVASVLYGIYKEEMAEFPEGNGPKMKEAWEYCMTPKEVKPSLHSGHSLSPKEAATKAAATESPALRSVLLCVTGQSDSSITEVQTRILLLEQAAKTLEVIRTHLGKEAYQTLLEEAFKAQKSQTVNAPEVVNA